jgi:hypothetical protein
LFSISSINILFYLIHVFNSVIIFFIAIFFDFLAFYWFILFFNLVPHCFLLFSFYTIFGPYCFGCYLFCFFF